MNSVVITGIKTTIAQEFVNMLKGETVHGVRVEDINPYQSNRYLFCQGYMIPKRRADQTDEEIAKSRYINYSSISKAIDDILNVNDDARICVIGSNSAFDGSYDDSYALNKKRIHDYVCSKKLTGAGQQIVAIAPTVVEDAGMTYRRADTKNLKNRRRQTRMGRFIYAREVAALAYHLLYEQPYISNTVIRMDGGNHVS
jgi:NAD(P)-dependent dehydrogenase (short-subunit alcohol dehydrogenase family)